MKIGLLAYHSACNFGATLQLLSTYCYFRNAGYDPIVINWVASDLEMLYEKVTPKSQFDLHLQLRKQLWNETSLCRTAQDVADVIKSEIIEAVVIGSDAVCQHHSFFERIVFPARNVFYVQNITSDRLFPNPFWATFNQYLEKPVPVAVMSASSQDSAYKLFSCGLKKQMRKQVETYDFLSVRDSWTADMITYITHGKVTLNVTPDPVFAFNYNAGSLLPSKADICKRFGLPERYLLMSFSDKFTVNQEWLSEFETLAVKQDLTCVSLPFSHKQSFGSLAHKIDLPLSPIDWYALIKYSAGYVGHNMHPIVVSLHNAVPFFSFDNYGIKRMNGLFASDKSSKIRHILSLANLSNNRITCIKRGFNAPKPSAVLDKLVHFDKSKSASFAAFYYQQYLQMMNQIEKAIK